MRISYFAWVREGVGLAEEEVALPPGCMTVADALAALAARSHGHAAVLADPARLRFALDDMIARLDSPLADAAELALFPPMTGGAL